MAKDYFRLRAAAVSLLLGASADGVEERSLVPRSRSHARLRRNATMSIAFSTTTGTSSSDESSAESRAIELMFGGSLFTSNGGSNFTWQHMHISVFDRQKLSNQRRVRRSVCDYSTALIELDHVGAEPFGRRGRRPPLRCVHVAIYTYLHCCLAFEVPSCECRSSAHKMLNVDWSAFRYERVLSPKQGYGEAYPRMATTRNVRRTTVPLFFLRRCPNAETLSRHESPDCEAKRGITHAQ
ncbi:hypothetical protein EVAR_14436_1 [Eumeta japonica]|uniref:Uncharacterized protein n=1 Tax=Eumeta variegata TaxID=151549 RepID=A0A4C1TYJ4_EUMVA|nr:hypothetical protein EVAR_14436_1 [Eumeta japonica]